MNPREFKERYLFDPQRDLIAEGTYSRVFHATDSLLQRDICIKLFRKELVAGSPLIRELSRAGVFFHPNVCAFYDLVEIEETNVIGEIEIQPIGIVEYMNGGMITDYVAKHEPDAHHLQKLIKDIIKGLSYLHSIGRPHLDLKPGNLLIKLTATEPIAKITDFLNSENLHTRSVPVAIDPQQLCYRAPECFENSYGEQGLRADIWSLGVMVYELVSGKKLFWSEGDTVEKVIRNVCYTDYWSAAHGLPEPYITFVKKCLVRNVEDRNVSLEELTLILDGYRTEEHKPIAPPVAVDVAPMVETVIAKPVKVPEVPVAVATIKKETPTPEEVIITPLSEDEAAQENKRSGLSVLIILGSLLILAGISAFIWKIIDDRHYPVQAAKITQQTITKTDTVRVATTIDSSGIRAEAMPKVVHDTVKLIQMQQKPVAVNYSPQPKPAPTDGSDIHVDVKVMPSLPYFDYLWVDKPYYFDLKTPLMSDDEYELYSETAAITALGKNTFYVKPTEPGAMSVLILEKGTHAKIEQKVYAVREKSKPIATIGDDITGGFVSPKMLLAKLTMSAKTDNGNLKIRSFHMTCNSGACDIQDVADNGKFNESMIKFLRNVHPGEKLYFDNIIAEDESGKPIKLDPFQITTY